MSRMSAAQDSALKRVVAGGVSVAELVTEMKADGFSQTEAAAALIALQRGKRLTIEETKPYSSLLSFALSPLSLWFWASLASVAVSLALISATSGVTLYLRYAFGSSLVLFVPGYSLLAALYPKRELDGLTRLALSIGLSLALIPLIGIVLNYTPFGVKLLPVALSIAGLAVGFLVLAVVRKHDYYKLGKGVT